MKKEFLIGPIIFLLLWFIITSIGLVNPLFLPSPMKVVAELFREITLGTIWRDIFATFYRVIIGFSLGIIMGIPVGILMGYSAKIYAALELIIDFFRSLPAMALFPLFLLIFGLGDKAKVSIALWASFLFIVINTIYGVKNCSQIRIMVAKTMKATKLQIFKKVIFPNALPEIFAGMRISISMSLVVVVVSEMFMGTIYGLGQRIYEASLMYRIPKMFVAILFTGILGYFLNKLFVIFESRFIHWAGK